MSVMLETTLGEIVVDLYTKDCYRSCQNFIKLCKLKFYNFHLVHSVERDFIAQVKSSVGEDSSIWGIVQGKERNLFKPELKRKHNKRGLISFVTAEYDNQHLASSQFFFTLSNSNLTYLDNNAVFGEIAEGMYVLQKINMALCDDDKRPFVDIRILHTIILDDPFDDIPGMIIPQSSPLPTREMLSTVRLDHVEKMDEITEEERIAKELKDEQNARALTLEIMGDLPFAEVKPPENVLFVAKLNPVTKDEDLRVIFSRFGELHSCEIVRDKETKESMCYAFIEFDSKEACEQAYIKMNNAIIDNRRIHCDFSQSVAKVNTYIPEVPKKGVYGEGLQKKTKYRDQQDEQKFEFLYSTKNDQPKHREKRRRSPEKEYEKNYFHSRRSPHGHERDIHDRDSNHSQRGEFKTSTRGHDSDSRHGEYRNRYHHSHSSKHTKRDYDRSY